MQQSPTPYHRIAIRCVVAVLGFWGGSQPAVATQTVPFVTPWDAPHRLGPWHSWGGEYVNQSGWRTHSEQSRQWFSGQELKLGWAAKPLPRVSSLLTLKWQKTYIQQAPDRGTQLGLESAYVSWLDDEGEPLLSLGRYYYEDSRGFMFHQSVDGVHGQWPWQSSQTRWLLRAFAGRQGKWQEDWRSAGSDDTSYGFVQLQAAEAARQHSVYLLSRETHTAVNDSPVMLGLRSNGALEIPMLAETAAGPLDYWLELALEAGESGQQQLQAYAIDVGAVWPLSKQFSAIAGYAYGSGDRIGDERDQRFRQSGLQLNNGWLGEGGVKLKYYGELSKPELSNIAISTLGLRYRPHTQLSLELLYHRYRQAQLDTRFYGFGLPQSPNGQHRQLGQELDLVIGYQPLRNLKLELNLAHFRYGQAFDAATDALTLGYVEARYRF